MRALGIRKAGPVLAALLLVLVVLNTAVPAAEAQPFQIPGLEVRIGSGEEPGEIVGFLQLLLLLALLSLAPAILLLMTCFVQRRPCAFASIVGTPAASCGVLTMTFVAFESAAVALPQEITPNAFASSCGKPPIHWWKTVVMITSS